MWDDTDFGSADPFVRYNAHQAAKGRPQLRDVDAVRKEQKEREHLPPLVDRDTGDETDAA